jgi:hypothetical protein
VKKGAWFSNAPSSLLRYGFLGLVKKIEYKDHYKADNKPQAQVPVKGVQK